MSLVPDTAWLEIHMDSHLALIRVALALKSGSCGCPTITVKAAKGLL